MFERRLATVGEASRVHEDAGRHAEDAVPLFALQVARGDLLALAPLRLRHGLVGDGDEEMVHPPAAFVPVRPGAFVPVARFAGQVGAFAFAREVLLGEEVFEGRGEDGGDLLGVEARQQAVRHVAVLARLVVVGVEQGDAGPDDELRLREVGRHLAQLFYPEGRREFGVAPGQTDFFGGLAAGGFKGGFALFRFAAGERRLAGIRLQCARSHGQYHAQIAFAVREEHY